MPLKVIDYFQESIPLAGGEMKYPSPHSAILELPGFGDNPCFIFPIVGLNCLVIDVIAASSHCLLDTISSMGQGPPLWPNIPF